MSAFRNNHFNDCDKKPINGRVTFVYNLIRVTVFILVFWLIFKGSDIFLKAVNNYGVQADLNSVMDIKNTNNELFGTGQVEEIISLDIDKAIQTFNFNPLQAKEEYEGKMVELKGTVLKIGYAQTESYLILVGSSLIEGDIVQCTFQEGQYKLLSELRKEDQVTVIGKVWIAENRFCMANCRMIDTLMVDNQIKDNK